MDSAVECINNIRVAPISSPESRKFNPHLSNGWLLQPHLLRDVSRLTFKVLFR